MKKSKYPLLNDELEKLLPYYENSFIGHNSVPIVDLCNLILKLEGNAITDLNDNNFRVQGAKTKIMLEESLLLCTNFLASLSPSIKEKFIVALKDGTINLESSDIDNIYGIKDEQCSYMTENGRYCDVNIGIYNNLIDSKVIIHEFFHALNFTTNNNLEQGLTHRVASECISIYFENKMSLYLKDQGYDEQELKDLNQYRFFNTFSATRDLRCSCYLLDFYQKTGNLSCENYQMLKEANSTFFESENQFMNTCKSVEQDLSSHNNHPHFFESIAYTLGTCLAFYCLNQQDSNMENRLLSLNDKIKNHDCSSLFECAHILGIELDDQFTEKVVKSYKKEFDYTFSITKVGKNK